MKILLLSVTLWLQVLSFYAAVISEKGEESFTIPLPNNTNHSYQMEKENIILKQKIETLKAELYEKRFEHLYTDIPDASNTATKISNASLPTSKTTTSTILNKEKEISPSQPGIYINLYIIMTGQIARDSDKTICTNEGKIKQIAATKTQVKIFEELKDRWHYHVKLILATNTCDNPTNNPSTKSFTYELKKLYGDWLLSHIVDNCREYPPKFNCLQQVQRYNINFKTWSSNTIPNTI